MVDRKPALDRRFATDAAHAVLSREHGSVVGLGNAVECLQSGAVAPLALHRGPTARVPVGVAGIALASMGVDLILVRGVPTSAAVDRSIPKFAVPDLLLAPRRPPRTRAVGRFNCAADLHILLALARTFPARALLARAFAVASHRSCPPANGERRARPAEVEGSTGVAATGFRAWDYGEGWKDRRHALCGTRDFFQQAQMLDRVQHFLLDTADANQIAAAFVGGPPRSDAVLEYACLYHDSRYMSISIEDFFAVADRSRGSGPHPPGTSSSGSASGR